MKIKTLVIAKVQVHQEMLKGIDTQDRLTAWVVDHGLLTTLGWKYLKEALLTIGINYDDLKESKYVYSKDKTLMLKPC